MKTTYTKKIMTAIVIVALIDLQFPFVLALFDKIQIAESLGSIIATEIIGVFAVYCAKSFFETREEKNNELMEKFKMEEMEGRHHEED